LHGFKGTIRSKKRGHVEPGQVRKTKFNTKKGENPNGQGLSGGGLKESHGKESMADDHICRGTEKEGRGSTETGNDIPKEKKGQKKGT